MTIKHYIENVKSKKLNNKDITKIVQKNLEVNAITDISESDIASLDNMKLICRTKILLEENEYRIKLNDSDILLFSEKPQPKKAQKFCDEIIKRLKNCPDDQKKKLLDELEKSENKAVHDWVRDALMIEHRFLIDDVEKSLQKWAAVCEKLFPTSQIKVEVNSELASYMNKKDENKISLSARLGNNSRSCIKFNEDDKKMDLSSTVNYPKHFLTWNTNMFQEKKTAFEEVVNKYVPMLDIHRKLNKYQDDKNSMIREIFQNQKNAYSVYKTNEPIFNLERDHGIREVLVKIANFLAEKASKLVSSMTNSSVFWKPCHTNTHYQVGEKFEESKLKFN